MLRRSVDVVGEREMDRERETESGSGSCLCQSKLETSAVLALAMKSNVTLTIDKSRELDRPNDERRTKTLIISNFIMIVLLLCAISSLRWWVSLFSCLLQPGDIVVIIMLQLRSFSVVTIVFNFIVVHCI